jgi:hypothetical protein
MFATLATLDPRGACSMRLNRLLRPQSSGRIMRTYFG